MKQGFLLKHIDMGEFEFDKTLIDKAVECMSNYI